MISSFQFIHTADIHLDSPLTGLCVDNDEVVKRIRDATREALKKLVSEAIARRVGLVLIAGDLYDGDWKDVNTGLFFHHQVARLKDAGITVALVRGNHDAANSMTQHLPLPENVKCFDFRKPETLFVESLPIAIHGQSFATRAVTENLVLGYPDPLPGYFNIGLLHTGIGGMGGHENYAPCALDELRAKGYDYWALGHVHQNTVLHTAPHIVFPGNLQGRHIRETGPKGAYLVTVTDHAVADLEFLELDVVRWHHLKIDVSAESSWKDVRDLFRQQIKQVVETQSPEHLMVYRAELTGTSPLSREIASRQGDFAYETRCIMAEQTNLEFCFEKIKISVIPAQTEGNMERNIHPADPILSMLALTDTAAQDMDLQEKMENAIGALTNSFPFELRQQTESPLLKAAIDRDYSRLIGLAQDNLSVSIREKV